MSVPMQPKSEDQIKRDPSRRTPEGDLFRLIELMAEEKAWLDRGATAPLDTVRCECTLPLSRIGKGSGRKRRSLDA